MKKGIKKCAWCKTYQKCKYRKGKKNFCTKEHKQEYYNNHIPTLKREIQIEFNRMVTKDEKCARCNKKFSKMDCSHVLSRGANDHLRFDILNVLPMCSRDHQFFWHNEPLLAIEWFSNKYPKRYDYLMWAKNQFKKWTADELHKIRKAIKDKDFQKLIRFKKDYVHVSG